MAQTTKREKNKKDPFRSESTLRACLIISLLFHSLVLISFHKIPILNFSIEEVHSYRVDLIRVPVEDLDLEKILDEELAKFEQAPEELDTEKIDFDTISLDTEDSRYMDYVRIIKRKILSSWSYPEAAKENLIEGNLTLMFSLSRDGRMTGIKIVKDSGFGILNNEAVYAVRSASPFPGFPDSITVSRLNVFAKFDYQLQSKKQD